MALKALALGSAGAAAATLTISGSTNAVPIVVTLGAGHGLKDGDRIAIAGITGNTNANGEWTLRFTGANTAQLLGSVGNGTHGGTPRVGVICDATPFMKTHSAVLTVAGNLVATLALEAYDTYADFAAGNNASLTAVAPALTGSGVTNTNGNATTTPASTSIALTAANQTIELEIRMPRILRGVVSSYTSGTALPVLKA